MQLSLFPLSAHIFPGGKLSLRIFEPRYIRMVKESCQKGTGFGICMFNNKGDQTLNQHIFPIGTFVELVDFETLSDGLLGITVKGKSLFYVSNIDTQNDGLRVGECEFIPSLTLPLQGELTTNMAQRLRDLHQKYPEVGQCYDEVKYEEPLWVLYRWLELLPLSAVEKQELIHPDNVHQAFDYLKGIVS